ncbi:hypothetical protein V8G54_009235 [Vigna mungo]|uniref:Auxin-responsive protein SAUR32 n=1 Tax=Vigna mungo TaxID=3915 RepID=A0AAQ3NXM6_VIGMU
MSNDPRSLSYSFLTHFNMAMADPEPWSFLTLKMGMGEKSPRSFQLHHRDGKKQEFRGVPKGCMAIKVGQGEEQQRFVVPVMYINHPLFMQLLKEAEEEYGFDQKGTITIPCHVEEFRNVRGLIDRDRSLHHHHHVGCFGF